MKRIPFLLLSFVCIVLLIPSYTFSQSIELKFEEFLIEDGLASVNCILKDKEGFIWFGGTHGLYRFDGYKFKSFKTNSTNIYSLSSNNIVSLYEDREGFIWIGTLNGGINKYNPKTETFLNYKNTKNSIFKKNYVTCITGNYNDEIWFGTYGEGIFIFNKKNNSFTKYVHKEDDENSISNNFVFSISIDDNNIWITTRVGTLDRYDVQDSTFSHYMFNNINYQSTRTGQRICLDALKNPWICTEGDGLYKFDVGTKSFVHFDQEDPLNPISSNATTDIKYASGKIYMTTYNGVNVIDTNTNEIMVYQKDLYNPYSVTYNLSYCLFIEDNNTIWLGMNDGTANKTINSPFEIYQTSLSNKMSSISANVVTSLHMGSNYLWIGTGTNGLDRLNLKTKTFFNYRNDPDNNKSIPSNIVMNVFEDENKNVWTGNFSGSIVGYKKEMSNDFIKAEVVNPFTHKFSSLSIFDMLEDATQNIWVATYNHGLFKYNKQTLKFEHFTTFNTNNGLNSDTILSILADSSNNLWIGTLDKGIQIYNQQDHIFNTLNDIGITTPQPNLNFPIKDIYEDTKGLIWIATEGGGLHFINTKKKYIKNLNTENGFPTDAFYGIIQDNDDVFWFSTNKGLISYNQNHNKIHIYNTNNGLPTNDFESGANAKDRDGKLYFGSKKGLISFYPGQLIDYSEPINLKLTTLKIFNNALSTFDKIENHQPLDSSISYKNKLKLPYYLNNFGFEFAVPGYGSPHNIEYQYKLNGVDNRWITTSSEFPFANYSNIPHGKYTFMVKAHNQNYYDPNAVSETYIDIIIVPVWWQTNIAYIVYFLLFSGFAYYIYKNIRDRIQLKNELLIEKYQHEKEEELHQSKINFFTTISHELRTSLTLVLSPLQQLSTIKTNNKAYNLIMTMNRNGERLLILINQILDFRKLESTKTQLNIQEINLKSFFKELCIPFYQHAEEKNIKFQLSVSNNCETGWVDANKLEIILYNILSNALKHTKDKIDVNIDLDEKDECLVIKIKDNGIGIKQENIKYIFENFYQENHNPNEVSGSGIGLAITKNLIDVHHGDITVKSEPNSYTIFNIVIPILKSYYENLDINLSHTGEAILDNTFIEDNNSLLVNDTIDVSQKSKPILLVVEDHLEIRNFIKNNFSDHFNVFSSSNGLDGKEKAFEIIPDIIISDIMMPKLNGLELCKTLKTDSRTSHIPIILLTARGSHTFKIEGFEYGADDYVTKPFNIDILNARVKNLIKSRQILRDKFKKEFLIKPKDIAINSVDEKFIEKTIHFIEKNMTNPKLSVADLATEIGMSHSVLYRKILALTGQTITEFIKSIRLTKAEQLILNSNHNLNEISEMVGFASPSYLTTCFKKKHGFPPREYYSRDQT